MPKKVRSTIAAVSLALSLGPTVSLAQPTNLFDGRSLDGWTFHGADDNAAVVQTPWNAKQGLLICRGIASGYLMHKADFENYVFTFEIRTMSTPEGNGMAVGSLGSVFINAAPGEESDHYPRAIEVSLRMPGDVFFRGVDRKTRRDTDSWVFRAPDFEDDVTRDMGEWNRVRLISNGKRLTVVINDKVVNQVEPIHRTRGGVAIKSDRGFIAAPTFYRNLIVAPISETDLAFERAAVKQLAKVKIAIAQQKAAEEAKRLATEQEQAEAQNKLAKEWSGVEVSQAIDFKADVRRLPYPANAQKLEFRAPFGVVEFESPSSLDSLSTFYRKRMAQRGWQVTETDLSEDEVTVVFQQGEAEVELNMDAAYDGVDVSLDCEGLSFEGTNDPASLAKSGVPQPKAYLFLQRELKPPTGYRDEEYEDGEDRLFKSELALPKLYEFLTQQLLQKGYRESRRPIITSSRRYSEFVKGGVEISVNVFSHEIGSRVVLTLETD